MIRIDHLDLTLSQASLICKVRPLQRLSRAAFAGQPFRLEDAPCGHHPEAPSFSEELVLGLIEMGLLVAIQQTQAWPGRAPARPFTVILTKEGESARAGLFAAGIGQQARAA